jgi:membrane fusion protein (multidrug efflux system)
MKKRIVPVLLVGVLVGLGWLVWFRPLKSAEEEKKPEPLVPVHVGKIVRATVRSYVTAYGVVEPEPTASARLAVGVPGVVSKVNCVEGQMVAKDAVLFEIDGRAAAVAVEFAQKTLERQKRLLQTEGTSLKLLQDAEQQWATARAQQALLQIRAPISGTVTRVNVKSGESADLTTVLAEMIDLDRLVVTLNVPSAETALLKVGQIVDVGTAESTNHFSTSLSFAGAQLDPKTGASVARAGIAPSSGLRPGQFVRTRVVIEERKDRLVVPLASVAKDSTGAPFIAVVEGEKAVLKPVRVGLRDEAGIEVEGEGVEVDKTVVTEGAYGLIATQQFATRVRVIAE